MEVLGDAKAVIDDDGDGRRSDEGGKGRREPVLEPRGGGGAGGQTEVWVPSAAAVRRAGVRSPSTAQAHTERESAWAEEDRAVARRLEHLDTVATRLEEAGAEIEANIDLLGLEHGRLRRAGVDHPGSNDEPPGDHPAGRTRTDEALGGGGGDGRARQRRRDTEVGNNASQRSPGTARGRLKARGSGVVSRRLVAPTVSSRNKAASSSKLPPRGAPTTSRGRGVTPSRSPARHRVQRLAGSGGGRKPKGHGDDDDLYEDFAGGEGRAVGVQVSGARRAASRSRAENVSEEEESTRRRRRARQRGRRGGERNGDSSGVTVSSASEEPGEWRQAGRGVSDRLLYPDDSSSDHGYCGDSPGGGGEGESGAPARRRERQEMEEQDEDKEGAR